MESWDIPTSSVSQENSLRMLRPPCCCCCCEDEASAGSGSRALQHEMRERQKNRQSRNQMLIWKEKQEEEVH